MDYKAPQILEMPFCFHGRSPVENNRAELIMVQRSSVEVSTNRLLLYRMPLCKIQPCITWIGVRDRSIHLAGRFVKWECVLL